jgi:hypothetical protein
MENLIGKYGTTLWKPPLDPEDAKWYNGGGPDHLAGNQGLIGKVIADDGDVLTVYSPERTMRFSKKDFKVYETPSLTWGEKVEIVDKGLEGEICDFNWHYNNGEYYYFVSVNGKRLKKRYFISELKKI